MNKLTALIVTCLLGCPAGLGGGGARTSGGEGLSRSCASGDFGVSAAARRVSGFLSATGRFTAAAGELQSSLINVCKDMGGELGMSDSELNGDVRFACDAVSSKLREEIDAVRGSGNVTISVAAAPPRCEISMEAYAECAAGCDVNVEPGDVQMECSGGEVVGTCSAECQGSCAVEVEGQCTGACEGTCGGGCTGTCDGTCEGTCSSTNADGSCNGTCDGTCHGTCSAGCEGGCEGNCWVEGQASCSGECRGGCSVEYTEPRCDTQVRPANIDADCEASCDASLGAQATCEPGRAEVTITGDLGEMTDRAERLRAALGRIGDLRLIKHRLERLKQTGEQLVSSARRLGNVREAGLQAIACITEAAGVLPGAVGSVSVSVEVSVSVSASASASTN